MPTGSCGNYQFSSCHCEPNTNNWIGTNSQNVSSSNALCGDPCEHSLKRRYVQVGCSVDGCTDDNAVNWDSDATIDDESCEYSPEINIPFQSTNEDEPLIIDLINFATDADNDPLSFSVGTTNNATLDLNSTTLTVTPGQHYYGYVYVPVSVTDGDYTDSYTFTLQVNPVNDPPSIDEPAYNQATIDQDYIYILRNF